MDSTNPTARSTKGRTAADDRRGSTPHGRVGGASAKPKGAASVVPVLPVLDGEAYAAESLAPVITAWLASAGVPKVVAGIDVRNLVRNRVKRFPSPVTRLAVAPAFGNRVHRYTLTEAADIIATFGRMAGKPDLRLPDPFAGRHSGATSTSKRTAPARRKPVARVTKGEPTLPAVTEA